MNDHDELIKLSYESTIEELELRVAILKELVDVYKRQVQSDKDFINFLLGKLGRDPID